MSVYQTKPRRLILCFLQQHPNRSYTAEELANALAAEYGAEEAPGKSTVYRLVSRLAQEDLIRRFEREGSHQSYYQITGCCGAPAHLHLKCTGCGRLIHMENQTSDQLLDKILKSSHFAVDEHQTVLYGRCCRCRAREQRKEGLRMKTAQKLSRPLLWLLILALLFSALLLCGGHLHRCAGDLCPVCQAARLTLLGNRAPQAIPMKRPAVSQKPAGASSGRAAAARSPIEKCDELTA